MSSKRKRATAVAVAIPTPVPRNASGSISSLCAVLTILTLAAFWNSFSTGLALDSRMLILGDPRIREWNTANLGLIFRHTYWWPNGEAGLYRPLTTLSFLINYSVLGNAETALGYHVINFFLHATNVLLVFALGFKLLGGRRHLYTAFAIAGLWAVHPVLTESVTNVAGRADLLAAVGVLSAILMYAKASESSGNLRIRWLIGVSLATGLGVFSKESAAVVPGLILAYELCVRKREGATNRVRWNVLGLGALATLLPIAIMLSVRAAVLSNSPGAEWPFVDNPIVHATFWTGRLTALKVLARYLGLAVWPAKLSADYSYSQIPLTQGSLADWLAWFTVALATVLIVLLSRRDRLVFFFACFASLSLLPASNLFFPIGTIMAERLLYLPLVGVVAVFVLVAEGIGIKLKLPRTVVLGFFAVLAAALCLRTIVRNPDWTSDRTMAEASILTSPESFKVHRLLAAELLRSDTSVQGIARATNEADKSVSILNKLPDPLSFAEPWTLAANCHLAKANLLTAEVARSEYENAVKLASRAISIAKASRAAYGNRTPGEASNPASAADPNRIIAAAYLRLNRPDLGLQAALHARTIDPTNPDPYRQMADAYLQQGKAEEAAITSAEGAFATGSEELRSDLIKLYQQTDLDTQKCAVIAGPRGPALNPACEVVRRDLCEATVRAHRPDLRQQLACPN